jgi:flavin-dependent dehydrogenase
MLTPSRADSPTTADSVDIVIVGYGPVGQALALYPARRGHSVLVLERLQDERISDHHAGRVVVRRGLTVTAFREEPDSVRDAKMRSASGRGEQKMPVPVLGASTA